MNENFKGFLGFWRGVFSEQDGTPSFSRVATGFIVGCALTWVTFIVWKTHGLPELLGLCGFVTVLYGTNKLSGAAASIFNKDKT